MTCTAALLLALALCAPAQADLTYQEAPRHAARYQARYEAFPPRARTVPAEVREVSDKEFEEKMGAPRWATGWYEGTAKPPRIWVVIRGKSDMVYVFTHEAGHHVHQAVLTEAERADWQSFWEGNKGKFPSDYSRKNAGEGFAEAWSVLAKGRKREYGFFGPRRSELHRRVEEKLRSYFPEAVP